MKKIELLSPAGNIESLIAAIEAGCDAVYLGGTLFGARAFAGNFNNEELIEAIKYAHLYGVKVYVTTNILIYEHEIKHFLEYIDFLYKNNVDAIIIQDLGMLDLVHKTYPNLEIHASTQMHIHNLDGVIMAQKLGVKRVVLARETSIDTIKDIKEKTAIDLEIFAHGALCVSYSGECLFSSLIGNRSGNRGSCVGSCRLPYKIIDENGNRLNNGDYPLSMKDLNTLEYIGKLIDNNVTSLKIEGRMKSPEYVYTVTKLYRMAIESYYEKGQVYIDEKELNNLKRIFNREFTKGYLFNESIYNIINDKRPNHLGIKIGKVVSYHHKYIDILLNDDIHLGDGLRIILKNEDYGFTLNEFYCNKKLVKEAHKNDIITLKVNKEIPKNSEVLLTKDYLLVNNINRIIKAKRRKIPIECEINVRINKPLEIIFNDGNNIAKVIGEIVTPAQNIPISREVIQEKINKIGESIYIINNLKINLDDNAFISLKSINELKRNGIELLNNKRLYQIPYFKKEYHIKVNDYLHTKLTSILTNKEMSHSKYNIVYEENESKNFITKLSKVMVNYDNIDLNKEYLVGELGAINKIKNFSCDYSFNVTNSYTAALLHSLGAKRITLSPELNFQQIKNIYDAYLERYHKKPNLEVIKYGFLEVMTLKTNLNKIYGKNIMLQDRFNNKYKIREHNGLSYIYHYKLIDKTEDYYSIGINVLRDNLNI